MQFVKCKKCSVIYKRNNVGSDEQALSQVRGLTVLLVGGGILANAVESKTGSKSLTR